MKYLLFTLFLLGCSNDYPWSYGTIYSSQNQSILTNQSYERFEPQDNFCEDNREDIERYRQYNNPNDRRTRYIQELIEQYERECL